MAPLVGFELHQLSLQLLQMYGSKAGDIFQDPKIGFPICFMNTLL